MTLFANIKSLNAHLGLFKIKTEVLMKKQFDLTFAVCCKDTKGVQKTYQKGCNIICTRCYGGVILL